jgi:hypothetical protein
VDKQKFTGQLAANTNLDIARRPAYVICLAVYDDGLDENSPNVQLAYSPMERVAEHGPVAKNKHPTELEMFTAFYMAQSVMAQYDPEIQAFLQKQAKAYRDEAGNEMQRARDSELYRKIQKG